MISILLIAPGCSTTTDAKSNCEEDFVQQKYQLTDECTLNESVDSKINPFWKNAVRKGVLTRDGIELHYAVAAAEDKQRAIVISSGRTEGMVKYKELIYDLSTNGYAIYIIDHRGQGFSSRMLEDRYKGHVANFQDYVDDFGAFLNEIVLPEQHQELFVLGHSMGGGIATLYLEQYPDVFQAAALSSPMHEPNVAMLGSATLGCSWFRRTYKLCDTCYVGFLNRGYSPKKFDDNILTTSSARYQNMLQSYQLEESAGREVVLGAPTRRWVREACIASDRMIDEAGKIKTPILVLQSGRDQAVTAEGQNEFCNALLTTTGNGCYGRGPVVKGLEGAKHELLIESDKYRNRALTLILDFFAQNGE